MDLDKARAILDEMDLQDATDLAYLREQNVNLRKALRIAFSEIDRLQKEIVSFSNGPMYVARDRHRLGLKNGN